MQVLNYSNTELKKGYLFIQTKGDTCRFSDYDDISHTNILWSKYSVCKKKIKFMKRYYGNQLKIVSFATELNLLYGFGKPSPFQMLKFNLKKSMCKQILIS